MPGIDVNSAKLEEVKVFFASKFSGGQWIVRIYGCLHSKTQMTNKPNKLVKVCLTKFDFIKYVSVIILFIQQNVKTDSHRFFLFGLLIILRA